jgi:SAM-dependent methyltransferase
MQSLPFSSAAERNRRPILDQLQLFLPRQATVLEIGSGTGQHAVFFSRNLPAVFWQPSDRQENLSGLEVCFSAANNERILPLLQLDVMYDPWPQRSFDAAYSANTAHIMSWDAVVAMFAGLTEHLADGARFCLYGPFNINNRFTSQSNRQFDLQLRTSNPEMGIRDLDAMESLANRYEMLLEQKLTMPANNFLLVFKKT